jgi:SMODS-associated and fused to various effectors sensor domain/CHAT domain
MAATTPDPRIVILFVSSDPSDLPRLGLGREEREIRAELQASEHRHRFELQTINATRSRDLAAALLRHRPHYLHFSGHGNPAGALFLENETGVRRAVQPRAMVDLLAAAGDSLRCVVLNACYSSRLATALLKVVPLVVGMRRAVDDDAAIAFSIGFYQALGAGCDPEKAFELGKAQVAMHDLPQRSIPVLKRREPAPVPSQVPEPEVRRTPASPPVPAPARLPSGRLRLGIRSFIGHGQEMVAEADRLLALDPYFDGRRVRHASLWRAAILPELARFLGDAAATRRPLHLNLATLPSIAFAAGYVLEAKGGYDILVRQRGLTGTADWRAAGGAPAAGPLWPIHESLPHAAASPDVAVAIGVTTKVLDDVRAFLARSGIAVGRILHASFGDACGQTVVRDGEHAAQLAQSICQLIAARTGAEKSGTVHLFVAAPNALVFFLGQMARGLGRIHLYDHDHEAPGVEGAYIPAFELPIGGAPP